VAVKVTVGSNPTLLTTVGEFQTVLAEGTGSGSSVLAFGASGNNPRHICDIPRSFGVDNVDLAPNRQIGRRQ
jgi:hypothetical protein